MMSSSADKKNVRKPDDNPGRTKREEDQSEDKKVNMIKKFFSPNKRDWINPCAERKHIFKMEDLKGAPDMESQREILKRASSAVHVQDIAKKLNAQLLNVYFTGIDHKLFDEETQFYRFEELPVWPTLTPNQAYFKKKRSLKASVKEIYPYVLHFTWALNMISIDSVVYQNETTWMLQNLEVYHQKIECETQMMYVGVYKFTPPTTDELKTLQLKMSGKLPQSKLARFLRHYLITRDYVRFMDYLIVMYKYFGNDRKHLP